MTPPRLLLRCFSPAFSSVFSRVFSRVSVLLTVALLAACSKDIPRYAPPAERPLAAPEEPWLPNQFLALAYHDVEDDQADQRFMSVRSDQLVEQLNWLYEHGYQAVSIDQILAARAGREPLPERAVLLSFDDGFGSFYRRVLPILKAWNWPAVLAPVGCWMDTPPDTPVDFGGLPVARERMLDWPLVAEIAASGLVEIAAHTDRSHHGIVANPQGNLEPAAAVRSWDAARGYETPVQFHARMHEDVAAISDKILRATGRAPRVWVWPYGAASGVTLSVTAEHGYEVVLTLEDGPARLGLLMATPRLLIANAPSLPQFATSVVASELRQRLMRMVHVELDRVYDPDPARLEHNLDTLVQRIFDLNVNTVFLHAYADPDHEGVARALYFPNRHLPMRADLFNRVAWQLRNRAHVEVYAALPVLAFDLGPDAPQVAALESASANPSAATSKRAPRLSPFDARNRRLVGELYEDLASHAFFDGLLFQDDVFLAADEDVSVPALLAYRAAGFDDIAALSSVTPEQATPAQHPEQAHRWQRFKTQSLTELTLDLAERVRSVRGPHIQTARQIDAAALLDTAASAWLAQSFTDALTVYDWVAPLAMPRRAQVARGREHRWLDALVDAVAAHPGALGKTVFTLQAQEIYANPHTTPPPNPRAITTADLTGWARRLQRRGARNFGYTPDDFTHDHPRLPEIRAVIATAWFPE